MKNLPSQMHDRPILGRLFLLVPAVLVTALAVGGAAIPPPTGVDVVTARGHVDAWRLDADGSLYVRVVVQPEGDSVPTRDAYEVDTGDFEELGERDTVWFKTPADQTDATRFEDLLLDLVLRSRRPGNLPPHDLTIVGDDEPEVHGRNWADAYSIVAVSQP